MKATMAFAILLYVLRQASTGFSVGLTNFINADRGMKRLQHHCRYFAGTRATTTRLFTSKNSNADLKQTKPKKKARKKSLAKKDKLVRVDRALSNRGVGSRSECQLLVKQGRVERMGDNKELTKIRGPSERISAKDTLYVNGEAIIPPPLLMAYHKPKWVLSVMHDRIGRPTVANVLEENMNKILHPVGRLDYDTSGLLLFSSNGKLTQRLLHPNHHVQKEYQAIVEGRVIFDELDQQLKDGVKTTEGTHTAQLVKVEEIDPNHVPVIFQTMIQALPPEYNVTDLKLRGYLSSEETVKELSRVQLIVSEGKHRMVRRVLANCGHCVIELKRLRQGEISLGDLAPGQSRILGPEEEAWAESLLMMPKTKTDQNKKKR